MERPGSAATFACPKRGVRAAFAASAWHIAASSSAEAAEAVRLTSTKESEACSRAACVGRDTTFKL